MKHGNHSDDRRNAGLFQMKLLMDTHAFLWLVEGHIKPLFSKPRMTRSIPFAISTEFLRDP
jgi:hypothetical protein